MQSHGRIRGFGDITGGADPTIRGFGTSSAVCSMVERAWAVSRSLESWSDVRMATEILVPDGGPAGGSRAGAGGEDLGI